MGRIAPFVLIASSLALSAMAIIPATAATWTERYEGRQDSSPWKTTISGKGSGVYAIKVSIASRMPFYSGDVVTTAKLTGDKLLVNDEDCSLVITP